MSNTWRRDISHPKSLLFIQHIRKLWKAIPVDQTIKVNINFYLTQSHRPIFMDTSLSEVLAVRSPVRAQKVAGSIAKQEPKDSRYNFQVGPNISQITSPGRAQQGSYDILCRVSKLQTIPQAVGAYIFHLLFTLLK